jgi:hypothetical protein
MSDRCPNGLFGAHQFQPRYDLGPANLSGFESIKGNGAGQFMEKLRQQTYVRDVCVKCGQTVERSSLRTET